MIKGFLRLRAERETLLTYTRRERKYPGAPGKRCYAVASLEERLSRRYNSIGRRRVIRL